MIHDRNEVIERTVREFKLLDRLVGNLSEAQWKLRLPRPETKDPWTVKDALAHVTYFKADVIRSIHGERRPPELGHGLTETEQNHVIYARLHRRSAQELLAWHRQVQKDVLAALRLAPDEFFRGRQRRAEWPFDLDAHSAYHRIKDIEETLQGAMHPKAKKRSSGK